MSDGILSRSKGILSAYIPASEKQKMDQETHDIDYAPFSMKKLIDAGVVRVTYPGNGKDGGYVKNEDPEAWSIVTLANDLTKGSYTKKWPDKPKSIKSVVSMPFDELMYDGKYNQILWSIKKLGLNKEDLLED